MLEERPPAELPARASAIAGASARVAAMNTASRMRHFSSRFDIATLVRKFRETRIRPIWARAQAGGSITRYRAVDFPAGAGPARAGRVACGPGCLRAGCLIVVSLVPNIPAGAQW